MKVFGNAETTEEYGTPHPAATDVEGVVIVAYDPAIDKWLALQWHQHGTIWLAGGGNEKGESFEQAAVRELKEETGYAHFAEQIQLGGPIVSHYYNDKKATYRRSNSRAFLFILDSAEPGAQELEEHENFSVVWMGYEPLRDALLQTGGGVEHWLAVLDRARQHVKGRVL
jgi:8-oxo-dGTP pyrophosphatase MutT (NUDIX family)